MNRYIAYFGLAGLLFSPIGYADEDATDDTVTVVDEGETPADVASHIALPDAASDTAREHAAFGQGVANQAHDRAGELGRAFGQQISEQAREQRSDARGGNAGDHPGRP